MAGSQLQQTEPVRVIRRGGSYSIRITLTDEDGQALVLDDFEPAVQLRRNLNSATHEGEFEASIVDSNVVLLDLKASWTLSIPAGRYVSQLLLKHKTDPDEDKVGPKVYEFEFVDAGSRR